MTIRHPELTVRPLRDEEWETWYRNVEVAFGGGEEAPEARELWRRLIDVERTLVACAAGRPVGGTTSFDFRLVVPGGAVLPAAGVAAVGVLPTHRRRGALSALMRRQLDDVRAAGEPLAVLTASEPVIYGRFGYGPATRKTAVSMLRGRVRVRTPERDGEVVLRLADPVAELPRCEELYAALAAARPGTLLRRPGWEEVAVLDAPADRGGFSPLQCVLAEDAASGELLGYARYAVKSEWTDRGAAGVVRVRVVQGAEPWVAARLWEFLLDLDLTERVEAPNLPVDDALLHLVSDVRHLVPRIVDGMYVRLVDLPAALAARGYPVGVDLVLEVTDAFCPWNAGRWRLTAAPGGPASCVRTGDAAELELDVRELGSVYLGGGSLAALAAAGLVRELRPGALEPASAAFRSGLEPWLPHGF
ncbi:GNAT family N-acetyltransferase [Kitasatospora sp. NA04385]|uniref:GNAT family N-acetyltransferase n=1 Tax=Kitasatospora sp. NA04385 TaxID=2742135 RepID=UPI0015911A92|nr:GNAT family N-acetyltransferase [Kitasatospora sp. NA04385]QKW19574.1 GNAT family N-acetyltransferase [Kitasatospora sp. NA04385]